jgi:hypothetical protein
MVACRSVVLFTTDCCHGSISAVSKLHAMKYGIPRQQDSIIGVCPVLPEMLRYTAFGSLYDLFISDEGNS